MNDNHYCHHCGTQVIVGVDHACKDILRYRLKKAAVEIEHLTETVSFFANVIKSGESWTPVCQERYDQMLKMRRK